MKNDDPRLTAYALGELSGSEREAVEAGLSTSPAAQQEVTETREMADLLSRALALDAARPDLSGVEAAIAQAISVGTPNGDASSASIVPVPSWRFRWLAWLGAAAATLAAIAGIWWFRSDDEHLRGRGQGLAAVSTPSNTTTMQPTGAGSRETTSVEQTKPPQTELLADSETSATSPATAPAASTLARTASPPAAAQPPVSVSESENAQANSAGGEQVDATSDALPAAHVARTRYGLAIPPSRPAETVQQTLAPASPQMRPTSPLSVAVPFQQDNNQAGMTSLAENRRFSGGRSAAAGGLAMSPMLMSRYGLAPGPHPTPALEPPLESARQHRESRYPDSRIWNPGYVDVGVNAFQTVGVEPLSTFSLDVDTGSYANVRRFLTSGVLPPPEAVRTEELINYFDYAYPTPRAGEVFATQVDVASCPWETRHRLVRIAIKARAMSTSRPPGNLVFLVDVSGSMQPAERLPLLKQSLRALVKRLSAADRVAIVTYATSAGTHLESTSCEDKEKILAAIDSLEAGGSTNGEGGIREAYNVAARHFIAGGVNRVLLCTDGDFNVGVSNQDELVNLIREKARSGVFLTTLGVGTDNFKDALMRGLADNGNGSYHYLDSFEEAQRVLIQQMNATFVVVARDAKAQVEFNPGKVSAWRLIGYEKRRLAHEDFNDDSKDAGDIGAGQTVTVLYEIVPAGTEVPGSVGPLKYQKTVEPAPAARALVESPELLTVKLRYQEPQGSRSTLMEIPVVDEGKNLGQAPPDFKFAAAVAAFGMALREQHSGSASSLELALDLGRQGLGEDRDGWRAEFLSLVKKARTLSDDGRFSPRPPRQPSPIRPMTQDLR